LQANKACVMMTMLKNERCKDRLVRAVFSWPKALDKKQERTISLSYLGLFSFPVIQIKEAYHK